MSTATPRPSLQNWFVSLSQRDQVRFLLILAHELTVVARSFYVPQTESLTDPAAVRAVNEIQHVVSAHAAAILADPAAGSHPIAYGGLEDCPDRGGLPGLVRDAVARAAKWTTERSDQ